MKITLNIPEESLHIFRDLIEELDSVEDSTIDTSKLTEKVIKYYLQEILAKDDLYDEIENWLDMFESSGELDETIGEI